MLEKGQIYRNIAKKVFEGVIEEEKAAIQGDIKDVMGEAKGRGYDTKAIRTIIRLRKKDANERIEEETILQTYMAALGME